MCTTVNSLTVTASEPLTLGAVCLSIGLPMHLSQSLSLMSFIQCICAFHVTPGAATNWFSTSLFFFPFSFSNVSTRTLPPPSPPIILSYLDAPVSKCSTVLCMECTTVCRLYGRDICSVMPHVSGWDLSIEGF